MINIFKWLFGSTQEEGEFIDGENDMKILAVVGQGSYGTVSLVRQESSGKLFAAKKSIYPGGSANLTEEINRCLAVSHRNIAKAYPYYFDNGDGGIHILTEFTEGPSLLDFIDCLYRAGRSLSIHEAACLGREIALGLQVIHSKKMVHRDLSCNNIILSDGRPVVIDFGLAKESLCSATGTLCGTPNFIAPEVGFSRATPRSDIFSVGSILYFIYFQRVIMDEYGRGLAPDLRFKKKFKGAEKDFVSIIEKAIALNPADRFSSAREMAAALKPLADGVDANWWCEYHNLLYTCQECCEHCEAPLPGRAAYCPYCGESAGRRRSGPIYPKYLAAYPCQGCDSGNSVNWTYCHCCGEELE